MFEVTYQSNNDKCIGYFTREQIEYLKKHTNIIILNERGI